MKIPTKERVEWVRKLYPTGTRVKLIEMSDPYMGKLREGCEGTVRYVDDMCTVHINWDCGSSLGAVYGTDRIEKM